MKKIKKDSSSLPFSDTPQRSYVYRLRTVLKRVSSAQLSILYAIAIYIGLIVSDPATSPFYAIENALIHVGHNYIVVTMLIVLGVAVSVSIGYAAIGFRFNRGEGGTGLVQEWLGGKAAMIAGASLLIDFVLTDAVTMAATVAALVSFGVAINKYVLALVVFVVVGVLIRLGDKGRTIFALLSYGFMLLVFVVTISPIRPDSVQFLKEHHATQSQENHGEVQAMEHGAEPIPSVDNLSGIALLSLLVFGAVRGFALLTGFEASVSALAHEEEKPEYARVAMGVGTIILVLIFTSFVTYNIASITELLKLAPDHQNTLFSLWTRVKISSPIFLFLLGFFSTGILLSGAASGANAGGGLVHVLVKARILPKVFTHIDNQHNDYKAMLIVHTLAFGLVVLFAVDELRIVSYYAISVLIGFTLTLLAAVKFGIKTKTRYLLLAFPGLVMVIIALLVNVLRMEGLVIIVAVVIMALYLYKKWIAGGKVDINFSH